MAKTATLNVRIEPEVKEAAVKILKIGVFRHPVQLI